MLTNFKRLLQLLFLPKRLKEDIVKQAVKDESKPKDEERWDHIRGREGDRLDQIRSSINSSILYAISIVVISISVVFVISYLTELERHTVQYIRTTSIIIVAWAVIFRLGYINSSWSKNSLPEQLQTFVFKFFYFIGVVGIIVSIYI